MQFTRCTTLKICLLFPWLPHCWPSDLAFLTPFVTLHPSVFSDLNLKLLFSSLPSAASAPMTHASDSMKIDNVRVIKFIYHIISYHILTINSTKSTALRAHLVSCTWYIGYHPGILQQEGFEHFCCMHSCSNGVALCVIANFKLLPPIFLSHKRIIIVIVNLRLLFKPQLETHLKKHTLL